MVKEVKDVKFVTNEMVRLDWMYKQDFIQASGRTNVVVAGYATAQARLKLYGYLERLETRAIYCESDSLVFSVKSNEWEPALGDYLGDLTDEVCGVGITAFVTGGPKKWQSLTKTETPPVAKFGALP